MNKQLITVRQFISLYGIKSLKDHITHFADKQRIVRVSDNNIEFLSNPNHLGCRFRLYAEAIDDGLCVWLYPNDLIEDK